MKGAATNEHPQFQFNFEEGGLLTGADPSTHISSVLDFVAVVFVNQMHLDNLNVRHSKTRGQGGTAYGGIGQPPGAMTAQAESMDRDVQQVPYVIHLVHPKPASLPVLDRCLYWAGEIGWGGPGVDGRVIVWTTITPTIT